MTTSTQNRLRESLRKAIDRSIRQNEIVHIDCAGSDIDDVISVLDELTDFDTQDIDYVELNEPNCTLDVWAFSGEEMIWRLAVTV